MNIRNVAIGLIGSALVAGVVVSCGGGGGGGGTPAATPPVASGTGRGALVVDATTRDISGGFSFVGVSGTPTSAGIYQAAAGANAGSPLIPLTIDRVNAIVPANTPALTPDQFFVCGDNSPASLDARLWDKVDPWVRPIDPKVGVVPRDLMIGKAFFVYFPSILRDGPIPVPDFGRMRFIW